MKRTMTILTILAIMTSSAIAHEHIYIPKHPKPVPPHQVQGGLGSAPWIVGGMVGCASVGLIGYGAYTANTQHRELTCREANMIVFGCLVPFVGAYIVDAAWKADPSLEAKCKAKP